MHRPTETALKNRARQLLEAMTERGSWVYAVPADGLEAARAEALSSGLSPDVSDPALYRGEGVSLRIEPSEALEVVLIEATGEASVAVLGRLLDKTGFFAQSQLLSVAYDEADEEAPTALGTLARMAARWDAEWEKLFSLHLSSPEPAVRIAAAASLAVAARRAGALAQARPLLERASAAEGDEAVKAALTEALTAMGPA